MAKPNSSPQNIMNIPLIDGNGDLLDFFSQIIQDRDLYKLGKHYNFVSIIGTQSTGKSTLLNKLFDTSFETLNQSIYGRQQTTKGILLSKSNEKDIFVLDIEGSDSANKWENRAPFENSAALFALVLSQVVIINMFTVDVGKYIAANYGILKVILENNIKLFKQEGKKKLIFTLRDYSDDENLEKLSQILLSDVKKIWIEIQKPREYQGINLEQFFDITIFPIHHYKYSRGLFNLDVENLKKIFYDSNDPKFLFKDHNYDSNIPMDGLFLFIEKIWSTIKESKDINLPSQKTMVATLRCSDIKNEVIESTKAHIIELHNKVKNGPYEKFGIDASRIINNACDQYDEKASNYEKKIAEDKKKELIDYLNTNIGEILFEQTTLIKKAMQNDIISRLNEIKIDLSNLETVKKKLHNVREETELKLKNYLEYTKLNNFDSKLKIIGNECQNIIYDQFVIYREKQLNDSINKLFQRQKRKLEGLITNLFNNLDQDYWNKLNESILANINELEELIKYQLADIFELDAKNIQNQIDSIRDEYKREIEIILRDKYQELAHYALKKFKTIFSRTENGLPIDWKSLSVDQIGERYKKTKKIVEDIINIVRNFETKKGYFDFDKEIIVSDKILENALHKLQDDFKIEYDNAIRANKINDLSNIPRWLWIILIYFMYDDVLDMIKSPYLFYPIMIILSFVALCITLGYASLPLTIVKGIYMMIKILLGQKLNKIGINI